MQQATLAVEWSEWDRQLVNLQAALKDDSTAPPASLGADDFPCVSSMTPPCFPLVDAGLKAEMRPALAPELVRQLDAATEEALICDMDAPYQPIGGAPVAPAAAAVAAPAAGAVPGGAVLRKNSGLFKESVSRGLCIGEYAPTGTQPVEPVYQG